MCARSASRSQPVTREEVIEKLKEFSARGINNPDNLNLNNRRVQRAHEALDEWYGSIDTRASVQADLAAALSRSTIYLDAGFTDPDYLDEVANDWLA